VAFTVRMTAYSSQRACDHTLAQCIAATSTTTRMLVTDDVVGPRTDDALSCAMIVCITVAVADEIAIAM